MYRDVYRGLYWMASFTPRTCHIKVQSLNILETSFWWRKKSSCSSRVQNSSHRRLHQLLPWSGQRFGRQINSLFGFLTKQALEKLQQTGDKAMQQSEVPNIGIKCNLHCKYITFLDLDLLDLLHSLDLTMSMFLKVDQMVTSFCFSSKKLLKSQSGMDLP